MVASAEGASEKMGGFRPEMGGARPLHFARPHIKHWARHASLFTMTFQAGRQPVFSDEQTEKENTVIHDAIESPSKVLLGDTLAETSSHAIQRATTFRLEAD